MTDPAAPTTPRASMPVTLVGMALHKIKQRDRLHGSPCYCDDDAITLRHWHESESLPDDRHSVIEVEALDVPPEVYTDPETMDWLESQIRTWHDSNEPARSFAERIAARRSTPAETLDVERLRRALLYAGFADQNWQTGDLPLADVEKVAAEYARLRSPESD